MRNDPADQRLSWEARTARAWCPATRKGWAGQAAHLEAVNQTASICSA
jgi:hypothetical protein